MNEISKIGQVPAFLAQASEKLSLNAAAHAGIQASFAVLKIRGKMWRIRHRGEEMLLQASAGTGRDGKPLPVTPVQHVDAVIVGIATPLSKKYFVGGFKEGESRAPDCFSVNGIVPDPASRDKQNANCATCQQNMWGSSINDATGKKSKACRDGRRIAVLLTEPPSEELSEPMLLDIPPTSLAALDRYTTSLDRMSADVSQVITRLSFDPSATHQVLLFEVQGWVPDAETYAMICEHGQSPQVERMLNEEIVSVTYDAEAEMQGLGGRPEFLPPARQAPGAAVTQPAAPTQTMAEVAASVLEAKAKAAAAAQAQVAQAQPVPEPVTTTVVKKASPFAAPPKVQAPVAQPPVEVPEVQANPPVTVVGAPDDMQAAIDNLLN